MQCTSPFLLKMDNGDIIEVPCGKCASCIISRQREWALRMMNELEYHEYSVFVTLTFRDAPYEISKRDLQLFIKRLRKELEPRKIKYYACGEYGENTYRPHYHCILYGLHHNDPVFYDMFYSKAYQVYVGMCKAWPFGNVTVGDVTASSCFYVSKYTLKQTKEDFAKLKEYKQQVPFRLMSRNPGIVS